MRRLCWMVMLLVLTGCQNVRGPLEPRSPARVDDPRLPISEQQRRARDQISLPDDYATTKIAPNSGATPPGNPNYR